jgi:hypothetical protein
VVDVATVVPTVSTVISDEALRADEARATLHTFDALLAEPIATVVAIVTVVGALEETHSRASRINWINARISSSSRPDSRIDCGNETWVICGSDASVSYSTTVS